MTEGSEFPEHAYPKQADLTKISECVPSVEMFRMLGSGTEACMCAVRVARLATGHKNIIKMGGAYHGWSDQLAWGMRVPGTLNLQSHGVPMLQAYIHKDGKDLSKDRSHQEAP